MTLASSAALIASLELQDKFTKPLTNAERALNSFEKKTNTLGAVGGHIKQGLSTATRNVELLGLAAGTFLVSQVKFGIDSLRKLEAVTTQTNAVIKSTGGVAGETSGDVRKLAEDYETLNSTIDDKVIQSGENLLLTFTNIRKNAFEPTLKAALDMNQAMGGGEAGLQGTIQKLGKALNDPVKGLTALGRVGITFSDAQKKQIADLVKHNKLFEAQKVILDELTKRFGGSFAAAGKTSDAAFAGLGDSAEDLQKALAEGILPALADVARELTTTFRDPATVEAAKGLGRGLGDAFKSIVAFAKTVPWKAIGDGLKTAASAAGTLIGKFLDAPDWLKTAVITGWGLNKLTGGAVTNIFGDLAKGIGGQFLTRGSSPVNPLFVKDVGVNLGGAAGAAGGAGGVGLLGAAGFVGLSVAGAALIASAIYDIAADEQSRGIHSTAQVNLSGGGRLGGAFMGGGAAAIPNVTTTSLTANTLDAAISSARTIAASASGMVTQLKANTIALAENAKRIETAWSERVGGAKGVAARSLAAFGKAPTKSAVEKTLERDQIRHLQAIEKSNATNATKLERLKAFAADLKAHGDTKTAAKVDAAIKDMKARIATAQQGTTTAVSSGADKVATAVVNAFTGFTVNVQFSASDVGKTVTKKRRYGKTDPKSPSGGVL